MRTLVTGGTGYLGSHIIADLAARGHEVRLLVRSPQRIADALSPFGLSGLDYVLGDVTDAGAVEKAMDGCDAVVHAAGVYSLNPRAASEMHRINAGGTDTVLGAAQRMGLDPAVHISSVVALFPPEGETLTTQSPVKDPPGAYFKSKAEAERIARRYQEAGAPVVIAYPGAMYGPHDPGFGESAQSVANILRGLVPVIPSGGLSIADVRDVSGAVAAATEPGRGPRRYMLSGQYVPFGRVIDTLAELTGRKMRYLTLPWQSLWPVVMAAGVLQRVLPFRLPLNAEGFDAIRWRPHGDDSAARDDLGFVPRDLGETLADMVRWMSQTGRISSRQAGHMDARAAS